MVYIIVLLSGKNVNMPTYKIDNYPDYLCPKEFKKAGEGLVLGIHNKTRPMNS
jgi:hypothetical protein